MGEQEKKLAYQKKFNIKKETQMIDVRTKDAIRKLPKLFEAQALEIQNLKDSLAYMKEVLREIKKTVTRGYNKTK